MMEPKQLFLPILLFLLVYIVCLQPPAPTAASPSPDQALLQQQIFQLTRQKSFAEMALAEAHLIAESEAKQAPAPAVPEEPVLPKTIPYQDRTIPDTPGVPSRVTPPPPTAPATPTTPTTSTTTPSSVYLRSQLPDPAASRPKVTLLLYNQFKGFTDWWREEDFMGPARAECSTTCTVIPTNTNNAVATADVVLFHVKTHSQNGFPPAHGHADQKWVMVSLEQPEYAPLMKNDGYVSKFDWTATYDLESTVPTITISPHFTAKDYHEAKVLGFEQKDGFGESNAVATFVSNCKAAGAEKRLGMMEEVRLASSERRRASEIARPAHAANPLYECKRERKLSARRSFCAISLIARSLFAAHTVCFTLAQLSKYIPVHNYGKCLKNRDEPDMGKKKGDRAANKQAVLQRYKFYLAFENNKIKDYVSEKVFDGLLGGTLPVYYGAESIDEFMPAGGEKKAVIKMDDFENIESLAKFLNELAVDESRYNEYFQWKNDPWSEKFQSIIDMTAYKYTSLCRFCQRYIDETAN